MVLKDANNEFGWTADGETDKGYNFILTDIAKGNDYGVILIKDTGEVIKNPAYIKTIPKDAFMAAKMRASYFYSTLNDKKCEMNKKSLSRNIPMRKHRNKIARTAYSISDTKDSTKKSKIERQPKKKDTPAMELINRRNKIILGSHKEIPMKEKMDYLRSLVKNKK